MSVLKLRCELVEPELAKPVDVVLRRHTLDGPGPGALAGGPLLLNRPAWCCVPHTHPPRQTVF